MEIIHLSYPIEQSMIKDDPKVMALGFFDGVHLGHQQVIKTAKQIAAQKKIKSAVMTFHPHPSVVLGKDKQHVRYITPPDDKARQIEKLGIDLLYVVSFNESLAALLPQEFVDTFLIQLNVKHVVAGFDFSYGRLGKGKMETLPFHSRGHFDQTTIDKVAEHDDKISSTLIREHILEGAVATIPNLLGRLYEVRGTVVHGEKRGGSKLGFPTANIQLADAFLMPPVGVYAVRIQVDSVWYNGVCNLGYKPTFHAQQEEPNLEVHIFDFERDIYGQDVTVAWVKWIRSERKFDSMEALIAQIESDKQKAEQFLAER